MRNEEVTFLRKSLDEELARCSRKCDSISRSIQRKEQGREGQRERERVGEKDKKRFIQNLLES